MATCQKPIKLNTMTHLNKKGNRELHVAVLPVVGWLWIWSGFLLNEVVGDGMLLINEEQV